VDRKVTEIDWNTGSSGAAGTWIYTGYIYDAGGNTMAIYNLELDGTEQVFTLQEQLVYGTGRLGILNRDKEIARYNTSTYRRVAKFRKKQIRIFER
jgi:hypothetical protein